MNKIVVVIFFFSVAMSEELKIGSLMPKTGHILNDISGKSITLADAKGESGTLVIFSCNTCPWVIRWEDRYVSIAEKYVPMGIGIIAVNSNSGRFKGSDSMEAMIEHADKENYNFPYAQDPGSELAYAFGATKTPHIYLFDKNNFLVYRGAIDDNARDKNFVDEPFLTNALDELLEGVPISKKTSKAIGCSIKFK